ncbi:hypothetical protein PAAG_01670 [Paracoccidioides lutzii Pb01]|uniref:Uncharacterized protein n=1 Tax=Paracoccidioides lutzii (strain ATCC MYA-826 / Pb01) TaxID=502779 RepID=C1GT25_PARBA|nr:hypothetical protein PAAG_01670 [Paracoccidioides lutzii Pb01]EEH39208.2 hypothetical protein PAAG_01670 [Paracoccidioides lutzii Pb01]
MKAAFPVHDGRYQPRLKTSLYISSVQSVEMRTCIFHRTWPAVCIRIKRGQRTAIWGGVGCVCPAQPNRLPSGPTTSMNLLLLIPGGRTVSSEYSPSRNVSEPVRAKNTGVKVEQRMELTLKQAKRLWPTTGRRGGSTD